jgi:hypothetical protein
LAQKAKNHDQISQPGTLLPINKTFSKYSDSLKKHIQLEAGNSVVDKQSILKIKIPEHQKNTSFDNKYIENLATPEVIINQIVRTPASNITQMFNKGASISTKALMRQTDEIQQQIPQKDNFSGLSKAIIIHQRKNDKASNRKVPESFQALKRIKAHQINTHFFQTEHQQNKQQTHPLPVITPNQDFHVNQKELSSTIASQDVFGKINETQMQDLGVEVSKQLKSGSQDALQEASPNIKVTTDNSKNVSNMIRPTIKITNNIDTSPLLVQEPQVIPKEVVNGVNQDMGKALKPGFEKELLNYQMAKTNYKKVSQKEFESTKKSINHLNIQAKESQYKEHQQLRHNVSNYQQEWRNRIIQVDNKFQKKAETENQSYQKQITVEQEKGQKEIENHYIEAEIQVEKEIQKAEKSVEQEEKKSGDQKEKKGFFSTTGKLITTALTSINDALKKAVTFIFNQLKETIKQIFEGAKQLVVRAITKTRKIINTLINTTGLILNKLIKLAFASFPEIAQQMTAKIDSACKISNQKLIQIEHSLRNQTTRSLNFLSKSIQSALNTVQSTYMVALNSIGMMIRGEFKQLSQYIFQSTLRFIGKNLQLFMTSLGINNEAMNKIIENPQKFIYNFFKSVHLGVNNFISHIYTHLKGGLFSWMFGVLENIPIQFPQKFDLKGIFYLAAQISGLTWEAIRAQIVKRLGPDGEYILNKSETAVDTIQELSIHGPIAIWNKIKEGLVGMKQMFFDTMIGWLKQTIVFRAFEKILSMINPAGIIVQGIMGIKNLVMFLYENYQRFKNFLQLVYQSLSSIIHGKISVAANYITDSLAKTVPIVISFLARLLGLHNITKPITKIIKKVSKPVRKVRDKTIAFAVRKIQTFMKKAKKWFQFVGKKVKKVRKKIVSAISRILKLRKKFKGKDNKQHQLFFEGNERNTTLMIASRKKPYEDYVDNIVIGKGQSHLSALQKKAKQIIQNIKIEIGKSNKNKKTDTEKKKKERKDIIDKKLEQLKELTTKLLGNVPQSENPKYYKVNKNFFGIKAEIKKLTKNEPKSGLGSSPSTEKHPTYDILNKRRHRGEKNSSYYVRGHLLNDNLYGIGEWKNMTPLSRTGNKKHEIEVESKVKNVVSLGGILYYSVKAVYKKTRKNKNNLIQQFKEKDGKNDQVLKTQIVKCEDDVPDYLKCEAKSLEESPVKWSLIRNVENPIDRKYEDYILKNSRPAPSVIKINSPKTKIEDYETLPGIGPEIAKQLKKEIEEKQGNIPNKIVVKDYNDLINLKIGIGYKKIAALKEFDERMKKDFGFRCIDFKSI